jgi:hypothetical protein
MAISKTKNNRNVKDALEYIYVYIYTLQFHVSYKLAVFLNLQFLSMVKAFGAHCNIGDTASDEVFKTSISTTQFLVNEDNVQRELRTSGI